MQKDDNYRIEDEVEQILEAHVGTSPAELATRIREISEQVTAAWPVPHAGDAQERAYALHQREIVMRELMMEEIADWRRHRMASRVSHEETCTLCRNLDSRSERDHDSFPFGVFPPPGRMPHRPIRPAATRIRKERPKASADQKRQNVRSTAKRRKASSRRKKR